MTINYDTDYDVQVVADGKHVEVWWGPAGGDMAKIIEVDSAAVMSGPRLSFLATANTVVRVDNIDIATPDTDRTTYTYNNGNELLTMVKDSGTTTFTYDDWGRQVSKIIGANSAVYTYRFGSMLKEINSTIPGEADLVQYTYDAFNKRREVRVTEASVVTSDQWYRYDRGFNAIARYDDGDLTDWVVGTRNQTVMYEQFATLSEVAGSNPSSGSYRYYLHGHLYSARALYDGGKVLLARVAYTPYGEQVASTAGVKATYSYTGKPWEEETGLYFFPFRYYSPSAARWAWRDPLGMVDGPNVYEYVGGNPLGAFDPMGLITAWFAPRSHPGCSYENVIGYARRANTGNREHCMAGCRAQQLCGSTAGSNIGWLIEIAQGHLLFPWWGVDEFRGVSAANDGARLGKGKCVDCEKACNDRFGWETGPTEGIKKVPPIDIGYI